MDARIDLTDDREIDEIGEYNRSDHHADHGDDRTCQPRPPRHRKEITRGGNVQRVVGLPKTALDPGVGKE